MNAPLSYDHNKRETIIASDGIIVHKDKDKTPGGEKEIPSSTLTNLQMMRGTTGKMTDFNVWNFTLPLEQMKSWTLCTRTSKGNIVEWDKVSLLKEGLEEEILTMKEICEEPNPGMVLLPGLRTFQGSMDICKKLGGHLHYARSSEDIKEMVDFVGKYVDECPKQDLFIGYSDTTKEGEFINKITNELMNNSAIEWNWGEPNGGRRENCVDISPPGNLNDRMCDAPTDCSLCQFEQRPLLSLRGLCSFVEMDSKYLMDLRERKYEKYSLNGWELTNIIWSDSRNAWELLNSKNESLVAFTNETSDYPVGTQKWYFTNRRCHDEGQDYREMNLHACSEDDVPCKDGNCISLEQTCNKVNDCEDGSDENKCSFIELDTFYNRQVPPPSEDFKKLANVDLNITINKVTLVDDLKGLFGVKMTLISSWNDARLTFKFLKNEPTENIVPKPNFGYNIWVPEIVFPNTRKALSSKQIPSDEYATIFVYRAGKPQNNSQEDLSKVVTYNGFDSNLFRIAFYSIDFECDFNVHNYPFDTQTCEILLSPDYASLYLVNFTTKLTSVEIEEFNFESFHLLSSDIFQGQIINKNIPVKNGIKVSIRFHRNPLKMFMKTYLPTIIINIINLATNYYEGPDMFEAIVVVNLTSLMVLVTLFISVLESLPDGPTISLIEIWLLFSLIIPFTIVILHTIVHVEEKKMMKIYPEMRMPKKMKHEVRVGVGIFIGRYVVPSVALAFALLYWAYGLALYFLDG